MWKIGVEDQEKRCTLCKILQNTPFTAPSLWHVRLGRSITETPELRIADFIFLKSDRFVSSVTRTPYRKRHPVLSNA